MSTVTHPAWLQHFADIMDRKSFKQFCNAYAASTHASEFLSRVIIPHLYSASAYLCIADRKNVPGRGHDSAERWHRAIAAGSATLDDLRTEAFFANALKPVASSDPSFRHPKERVVFAGPHVFTFEFDRDDIGFIQRQLSWCRPEDRSKPLVCKIGEVHRHLSKYTDFEGITVAWSGGKSYHIHVVFDPSTLLAVHPQLTECDPRDGFIQHWERLWGEVKGILDPRMPDGTPVEPDRALRCPEGLRRLPGGTRLVDRESVLGIPIGTVVPQLVMWERFRQQAGANADALFFSPLPFLTAQHAASKARNVAAGITRASSGRARLTNDERAYVDEKLRQFAPLGSYPEYDRLEWTASSGWAAYFRNSATDRNASSVMKADFLSIFVQGVAPNGLIERRLPRPLSEQIELWREEHLNNLSGPDQAIADEDFLDVEIASKQLTGTSTVEMLFTSTMEAEGVHAATEAAVRAAFSSSRFPIIKSPEGMRKTSTVMAMHEGLMDRLKRFGLPSLGLYAFTDYVSAREKCTEFNEMQERGGSRYRGIVISSFSALYAEACSELGLEEITRSTAAASGYNSIWEAVERTQPSVLRWMADEQERTWASIEGYEPVFFAAHEVAHNWKNASPSRLMWARHFWRDRADGVTTRDRDAKAATRLGIIVHDEVDPQKLVLIERAEVVEWVQALVATEPSVWNLRTSLKATWASMEAYIKAHGHPHIDGEATRLTFERVRELAAMGSFWEPLTLDAEGAYGDLDPKRSLYTSCLEHRWMAQSRCWWRTSNPDAKDRVAEWVVILTTEELPCAVARQSDRRWSIFSLEAPSEARAPIETFLDRSVTARSMRKTCKAYRAFLGEDVHIVSNSVSGMDQARSPISARGANCYRGAEVLQTLPFAAVEVHERCLVWNAYTGRSDCLLLHHIDMLNQIAGRNLGYRHQAGARHYLVANTRLFEFLLDGNAFAYCRYDLLLRLSQKQRAHIRTRAR